MISAMPQRIQRNRQWRRNFCSSCLMLLPFTNSFTSSPPSSDQQCSTSSTSRNTRIRTRARARNRFFNAVPSSRLSSTTSSINETNHTRLISFVTDIEGDMGYFKRFIQASRILDFEHVEPNLSPGLEYFPYDKRVVFQHSIEEEMEHMIHKGEHDDDVHKSNHNVNSATLEVDPKQSILVFGGDVCDKGGNDLYVIRQLLSLKKRYGNRVHFIMGNRDINKMRILQELGITSSSSSQEKLPPHGGINWFRGTGLQGDPELIHKYYTSAQEDDLNDEEKMDLANILVSDVPAERLKWILRKTMGSPDAFEFRRNELKEEQEFVARYKGKNLDNGSAINYHVSDEEVVESYRNSCHPTHGVMGEYLSEGRLCLIIGGAMFMHGSLPITPEALSQYENASNERTDIDANKRFWAWFLDYATPFARNEMPASTSEWANGLNAFAKRQDDAWKRNITFSETSTSLAERNNAKKEFWSTGGGYQKGDNESDLAVEFGSLCQYGMGWLPDRSKNPTVVYNSWMQDGMPRYLRDEENASYKAIIDDFFEISGLDVIVTGHQPVGDVPFPIRVGNGCKDGKKKFIICADTSYSGDTKWMQSNRKNVGRGTSVSGRGDVCVSEIILEQRGTGRISSVFSHGTLSNGERYESKNFLDDDDNVIGREVDRERFSFEGSVQDDSCDKIKWFVKSKFLDGEYLVSTGKGYEVFNSIAKQK